MAETYVTEHNAEGEYPLSTEFVAAANENGVVADLAQAAAEPTEIEPGKIYTIAQRGGGTKVIDTDEFAAHPRRTAGMRRVTNAESFVRYIERHGLPSTEVYAHLSSSSVVGIIDSHEGSEKPAGREKHRVVLDLEHSKEWIAWNALDLGQNPGGWMSQVDFAEFIEARALDVHDPDHATLIEIATTFEAKRSAEFSSSTRLDNGDIKFDFTEQTAAKAGQKGSLEIPKSLKLALRPYVGGPRVWVMAQFRYRLNNGVLKLGFALERPEVILETAFDDIVTEIRDGKSVTKDDVTTQVHPGIGASHPIFLGRP